MDDNDAQRAHKKKLAKLGRAFREAREHGGLSERRRRARHIARWRSRD